jgi:hypothetical protein
MLALSGSDELLWPEWAMSNARCIGTVSATPDHYAGRPVIRVQLILARGAASDAVAPTLYFTPEQWELSDHRPLQCIGWGNVWVYAKKVFRTEADALEAFPVKGRRRIPKAVQVAVWRRDLGRCVECGNREHLEFDHIIPVAEGGSNTERNVQLLCESCNRRKGKIIGW